MVIKKLYLDPFLDMFNGEILTYCISKTPSAASVLSAQQQAIAITSDCPYRRTFHSDRGWAYQMGAYSSALKENKIFQSMSRKGNCYDNSVMENFFGILKQEMYYGTTYYSFDELKEAIERYIKYYNETRMKEKLGWMSRVGGADIFLDYQYNQSKNMSAPPSIAAIKLLRYKKSNFLGSHHFLHRNFFRLY